jgi:DNA-binding response OmpR family regulator
MNIGIVEDHEILREELGKSLTQAGHEVFSADCGDALNDILIQTKIHVLIVDLNLPDEDGLSIVTRVKKAAPDIGIIILSARIRGSDRTEGYKAGADVYITKPTRSEEIIYAVQNLSTRVHQDALDEKKWILDTKKLVLISPENNIIDLSNSEYLALSLLALSGNVNLYQFQEVLNSKSKDLSREQLENLMSRIRKKIRPHIHGSTEIIKSSWGESSYRLCFDINLSR